jgi:hypothetical protein
LPQKKLEFLERMEGREPLTAEQRKEAEKVKKAALERAEDPNKDEWAHYRGPVKGRGPKEEQAEDDEENLGFFKLGLKFFKPPKRKTVTYQLLVPVHGIHESKSLSEAQSVTETRRRQQVSNSWRSSKNKMK